MFACTLQGGTLMAFPDTCKTPTPGGPVPVPYPNTGQGSMANPGTCSTKVLISCTPAQTTNTQIAMTSGDEAGVAGGVVSSMIKGPAKYVMVSLSVMIQGGSAGRLTSPTQPNGTNANPVGAVIAPSQTTVIVGG